MVIDALYIRDHLDQPGASHIIEKHSGRCLPIIDVSSQNPLPVSIQSRLGARLQAGLSPPRPQRQSSNLENILQDTAKGLFTRSEKWGINKAVRDAVEEVRKGVRDIQSIQTPPAPRRHTRTESRQSGTVDRASDAGLRLTALEQRTAALAKMLKSATDELWDYHKEAVAANNDADSDKLKGLSIAIAKIQFAQVYLEDPSVPLATDDDEAPPTEKDEAIQDEAAAKPLPPPKDLSEPAALEPQPQIQLPILSSPTPARKRSPTRKPPQPADFQTPRPSLAQSSFSWMLGQSTTSEVASSFVRAEALPPSDIRRRSKGFLFGDDEDEKKPAGASGGNGNGGKAGKTKGKDKKKRNEVIFEQGDEETEEFDLGALEEEKAREREKVAKVKEGGA